LVLPLKTVVEEPQRTSPEIPTVGIRLGRRRICRVRRPWRTAWSLTVAAKRSIPGP